MTKKDVRGLGISPTEQSFVLNLDTPSDFHLNSMVSTAVRPALLTMSVGSSMAS